MWLNLISKAEFSFPAPLTSSGCAPARSQHVTELQQRLSAREKAYIPLQTEFLMVFFTWSSCFSHPIKLTSLSDLGFVFLDIDLVYAHPCDALSTHERPSRRFLSKYILFIYFYDDNILLTISLLPVIRFFWSMARSLCLIKLYRFTTCKQPSNRRCTLENLCCLLNRCPRRLTELLHLFSASDWRSEHIGLASLVLE